MKEKKNLDRVSQKIMQGTLQTIRCLGFLFCFILIGCLFFTKDVNAAAFSNTQREYINELSRLMMEGTVSRNMDIYKSVSQGSSGRMCMRMAALNNRAAIMAERIDFLDSNWEQYYAVEREGDSTVFNSTKLISRAKFQKRYRKIIKGLDEALESVDSSMSQADKAMAVYTYFAKNTVYKESADEHTGYDVLVNHVGVCDGLANAYALAMNTLGIPCAVVSNYTKNHSWNIIKLNGKWYYVDLTNGVGTGKHEGLVVSYESFLVGKKNFLKTHPGYRKKDLYGQGNSNDLNLKKIALSSSDYIKDNKEIKSALKLKTCTFYRKGYWYWVSPDGYLKRSTIQGKSVRTVYSPPAGKYIGWITQYNNRIIFSMNSGIYRMRFDRKYPVLLRNVDEREDSSEVSDPLWKLIYIGRFRVDKQGYLSYYISDFHGVRKGHSRIYLGKTVRSGKLTQTGKKTVYMQAGQVKQITTIHMHDRAARSGRWTSGNSSVVSISSTGYMVAKKAGRTYITTRINGRKRKFIVQVSGYTITYRNAGVNSSGNRMMASGKKEVLLKEPKRKGYTFLGWYDRAGQPVKSIPKGNTKNITVYAKWEKISRRDSLNNRASKGRKTIS